MRTILCVSMLLLLGACECLPKPPVVPPSGQTVKFDERLLQDCPDLPKAKSARDEDIKENGQKIMALWKECRDLKAAQNREVKKMLNIK